MITIHNLPWVILACIPAGCILSGIQNWFAGQYEVTRRGFRFGVTRRWYGPRAWVIIRGHEDDEEPERFRVLNVDTEDTQVPWLKAVSIEDDGAGPFWAPVTAFAPEAVRRLRPWVFRYRRLRLPVLFAYKALPRPAGYPGTDA